MFFSFETKLCSPQGILISIIKNYKYMERHIAIWLEIKLLNSCIVFILLNAIDCIPQKYESQDLLSQKDRSKTWSSVSQKWA